MLSSSLDVVVGLVGAVGTAETLDDVFAAALDGLHRAFGIPRASILLFDPDGVMRFKAWRGLSDEYRTAVEGHTPWTPGQPAPDPIVVPDVRSDSSLDGYHDVFAREHIVGLVFVPLIANRVVIGKFMLYPSEPASFGPEHLRVARAIGSLVGFAVERMQRADAAQSDRQRLLFALDAASMGTWDWDLTTQRVQWSENLERIHGLPAGTFDGGFASYEREIHPDDRSRVFTSIDNALTHDAVHDVEYRLVAPDGTVRWALGKGRVHRNAAGEPVRMTGVCMDITGRRAVQADNARLLDESQHLLDQEAALRQSLTTLTDGSGALLTALGSDAVVSEVLALATRVFRADGYAVWRRTGTTWRAVGSRGLSERFAAEHVPAGQRSFAFDRPLVAPDLDAAGMLKERLESYAQEGLVSLLSVPLAIRGDVSGSVVFYYRSRHEVTDGELKVAIALGHLSAAAISNAEFYEEQRALRSKAETAQIRTAFLAEATARLSSLDYEANLRALAQLAVPRLCDWCAIDLRQDAGLRRLVTVHPDPAKVAMAEELQQRYPADPTRERGPGQVIRTGIAELYPDITDELLTASAVDADHLDLLRSLGLSSAMMVPLAAGGHTFGVMTFVSSTPTHRYDVSDLDFALELARRAGLAVDNARLYREAQNANRLKDEFLATLSHELRTPLNVILGRSRMIDGAPDLDAARQLNQAIERNAVTLAKLVDDLLDVSRMTVGHIKIERQPLSLSSVVEAAVQAVQPAIEAKRLVLTVDMSSALPMAQGDPTRLQQIVWNLLTNASKFTPVGGAISVSLTLDTDEFDLRVRDTGEGLAPDALPRIFDLFWQVEPSSSRRHGGLGLGLSLVRKLVELHGGQVRAESDGIGRGTTMIVRLPVQPTAAAAPPPDSASGQLQSLSR